jgi:uncharacterized protein YbjT (DUF2867 family)
MILVLGSTGNTGREVARQLIATGEIPRLLVRNRAKAAEFESNAQITEGDLRNPGTLQSALDGIERTYLVSTGVEGRELEKKFIDVAKESGVRHIVKISAISAEKPTYTFAKWHAEIEKHLMESGLDWTMIRPGCFATNALMFWSNTIKTQSALYFPTGDGRWPSIDSADVAAVAVKALTTSGHEGQGYTITGAESMSAAEYADTLSKVLGKAVKFVDVPPEVASEGMLQSGMPADYVDAIIDLMAIMKAGNVDIVTDTFERLMGRKPTSFSDWARRNRVAFE